MAPEKLSRECKQCFRVVQEKHYEHHLLSHDHQVKACVLHMGSKILSSCTQCKDTKIAQVRAQCIKCCRTLEKMYDAILKPLEPPNVVSGVSTLPPQKGKGSKFNIKFLNRALKTPKIENSLGITRPHPEATKQSKLKEYSSGTTESGSKAAQPPKLKSSSVSASCSKAPKAIPSQFLTKSTNRFSSNTPALCSNTPTTIPGRSPYSSKTPKLPKLKTTSSISRPCSKYPETTSPQFSFETVSPPDENYNYSKSNSNQLSEKHHKALDLKVSKTLHKPLKTSHMNERLFEKPSNEESLAKPHNISSKALKKSKNLSLLNRQSTETSNEDTYYIPIPQPPESTNTSSNSRSLSFDQQQSSQSPDQVCKKEQIIKSEPLSFDNPSSSRVNYNPLSTDKVFKIKLETPQPSTSTTIATHHSAQLAISPSTIISVEVVESSSGDSEYTFKFCKRTPTADSELKNLLPDVNPDTGKKQPVTRFDQQPDFVPNLTETNYCGSKTFHQFEEELGNLFPQLNSDTISKPLSPITTEDLVTTLLGVKSVGDDVTVYDDWYLAPDIEPDCRDPIEQKTGFRTQKKNDFHDPKHRHAPQGSSHFHDTKKTKTGSHNKKVKRSQINKLNVRIPPFSS